MMKGRIASLCTDGTSALRLDTARVASDTAVIVAFPQDEKQRLSILDGACAATGPRTIGERMRDALYASEMYCSLKLEDFRGCPYRIFTQRGIAVLSAASAAIAVISIAMGA